VTYFDIITASNKCSVENLKGGDVEVVQLVQALSVLVYRILLIEMASQKENKTASRQSSGNSLSINGSDVQSWRNEKLPWSGTATPDGCLSPSTVKSFEGEKHVNVREAEDEFKNLDLELKISHRQSAKRVRSRATGHGDLEKGNTNSEPFDLEATLRGDRADAEAAGGKFKKIGVIWNDLTVKGMGGSKLFVQTFPSKCITFFNVLPEIRRLFGVGPKFTEVDILKSFSGVVRPGEMVLVLGRPGSGCTSFLKVISNQRFGYTNISGDVQYGQFNHEEFSKLYRGEAVYNAEDESSSMLPTLTVGQTLDFALNTKLPSHRPAGLSKKEFKEKVITMLLRMFNIEVCINPVYGVEKF
jgi:ATP-binding cassette subfamily G (WHITE) protein 2 (SNQ2)